MRFVNCTLDCTERFFQLKEEDKTAFAGSTSNRLAPYFGYRNVPSMHKQFFVFRNTELLPLPRELVPLKEAFGHLIDLLSDCMKAMVPECDLGDCRRCIEQLPQLRHSSFLEIFRYECSSDQQQANDRVRVACAEHRDTSLLTLVPRARGAPGLEGFDWEHGWRRLETEGDSYGGTVRKSRFFFFCVFSFCAGCCVCRRAVLLHVSRHGYAGSEPPRLRSRRSPSSKIFLSGVCVIFVLVFLFLKVSIKVELLPEPTEKARQLLSSLGKGLVSVNY